jgi:selenocysteine lyase/cysteine desulfurase
MVGFVIIVQHVPNMLGCALPIEELARLIAEEFLIV